MYYILSNAANSHALTWYQGSFASLLYPNADLHSQRISDFLTRLGQESVRRRYFQAHISWLKKYVSDDPAVIVDSTGLPNAIRINLTQPNIHNGKLSVEGRLITAVQRDSGYPFLFRAVPGNVVDVSTLSTTILTLAEYNVKTDLALLDAGYYSASNIDDLYDANIDFVSRLPESNCNL